MDIRQLARVDAAYQMLNNLVAEDVPESKHLARAAQIVLGVYNRQRVEKIRKDLSNGEQTGRNN